MKKLDDKLWTRFLDKPGEESFQPIYDGTKNLVYTVCWRLLGDREEAADALQGTYARLLALVQDRSGAAAVEEGGENRITITIPFTQIHFRLLDHTGNALPNAQVNLVRQQSDRPNGFSGINQTYIRVNGDGNLNYEGMAPGTWDVRYSPSGGEELHLGTFGLMLIWNTTIRWTSSFRKMPRFPPADGSETGTESQVEDLCFVEALLHHGPCEVNLDENRTEVHDQTHTETCPGLAHLEYTPLQNTRIGEDTALEEVIEGISDLVTLGNTGGAANGEIAISTVAGADLADAETAQ